MKANKLCHQDNANTSANCSQLVHQSDATVTERIDDIVELIAKSIGAEVAKAVATSSQSVEIDLVPCGRATNRSPIEICNNSNKPVKTTITTTVSFSKISDECSPDNCADTKNCTKMPNKSTIRACNNEERCIKSVKRKTCSFKTCPQFEMKAFSQPQNCSEFQRESTMRTYQDVSMGVHNSEQCCTIITCPYNQMQDRDAQPHRLSELPRASMIKTEHYVQKDFKRSKKSCSSILCPCFQNPQAASDESAINTYSSETYRLSLLPMNVQNSEKSCTISTCPQNQMTPKDSEKSCTTSTCPQYQMKAKDSENCCTISACPQTERPIENCNTDENYDACPKIHRFSEAFSVKTYQDVQQDVENSKCCCICHCDNEETEPSLTKQPIKSYNIDKSDDAFPKAFMFSELPSASSVKKYQDLQQEVESSKCCCACQCDNKETEASRTHTYPSASSVKTYQDLQQKVESSKCCCGCQCDNKATEASHRYQNVQQDVERSKCYCKCQCAKMESQASQTSGYSTHFQSHIISELLRASTMKTCHDFPKDARNSVQCCTNSTCPQNQMRCIDSQTQKVSTFSRACIMKTDQQCQMDAQVSRQCSTISTCPQCKMETRDSQCPSFSELRKDSTMKRDQHVQKDAKRSKKSCSIARLCPFFQKNAKSASDESAINNYSSETYRLSQLPMKAQNSEKSCTKSTCPQYQMKAKDSEKGCTKSTCPQYQMKAKDSEKSCTISTCPQYQMKAKNSEKSCTIRTCPQYQIKAKDSKNCCTNSTCPQLKMQARDSQPQRCQVPRASPKKTCKDVRIDVQSSGQSCMISTCPQFKKEARDSQCCSVSEIPKSSIKKTCYNEQRNADQTKVSCSQLPSERTEETCPFVAVLLDACECSDENKSPQTCGSLNSYEIEIQRLQADMLCMREFMFRKINDLQNELIKLQEEKKIPNCMKDNFPAEQNYYNCR